MERRDTISNSHASNEATQLDLLEVALRAASQMVVLIDDSLIPRKQSTVNCCPKAEIPVNDAIVEATNVVYDEVNRVPLLPDKLERGHHLLVEP